MTIETMHSPDHEGDAYFDGEERKKKYEEDLRKSRDKASKDAEKQERINKTARDFRDKLNKNTVPLEDDTKKPEQPNMFE